jgi:hypothetical protein
MNVFNEHFKVKEYQKQLSNINKKAIELKISDQKLKYHLKAEANILACSLCLLLHIQKYEYAVAHLLRDGTMNNQQAISLWVLNQLVEVGFPYHLCALKELKIKLEIELNRLADGF